MTHPEVLDGENVWILMKHIMGQLTRVGPLAWEFFRS
jgi:hypothetical protein